MVVVAAALALPVLASAQIAWHGVILFRTPFGIYAIDSATNTVREVARDQPGESLLAPAWSPDGTQIAYTRSDPAVAPIIDRHYRIHVMDPDGGGRRAITPEDIMASGPSWSPDGTRIVFTRFLEWSNHLFFIDTDGGNLRPVIPGRGRGDYDPAWSPDGRRIAFTSVGRHNRGGELEPSIYVVDVDGSNIRRLTDQGLLAGNPSWSPESMTIAFHASWVNAGRHDLWIVDANAGEPRRITGDEFGSSKYPEFAPNGRQLAFAMRPPVRSADLYVCSVDGDSPTQITRVRGGTLDPSWLGSSLPLPAPVRTFGLLSTHWALAKSVRNGALK